MATPECSELIWSRDVGQFAGSDGVSAGVVVEKSLVWAAWEGPKGGRWFLAGWGWQSGRGEALSQQQLPRLGPAFKPCWPCTVISSTTTKKGSFLTPGWKGKCISLYIPGPAKVHFTWEDPSWPCSAGCLTALWIPLFNCHLVRLWDP